MCTFVDIAVAHGSVKILFEIFTVKMSGLVENEEFDVRKIISDPINEFIFKVN